MRRWVFGLGLVLSLLLGASSGVASAQSFTHGSVVALSGTPHLWIADAHGVLHWGGDTRALSGRHVNWSARVEVSLAQLRTFPIGDPWLSAGLLKDGEPIYVVKWETEWPQPRLLHIQSIADVELFGINGSNYGQFVLDVPTWEARYGIPVASLQRGVLPPATAPPPPPPPPPPAGPASCPDGQRWDYYKETCVDQSPQQRAENLVDPALMPALDLVAEAFTAMGIDGPSATYALIWELRMPVRFGAVPRGKGQFSFRLNRTSPPWITINSIYRGERARALAPTLAHELIHAMRYYQNQSGLGSYEGCLAEEILAETAAAAVWSEVRPGGSARLTDLEWQHEINYYDWLDGTLAAEVRYRYRYTCAA